MIKRAFYAVIRITRLYKIVREHLQLQLSYIERKQQMLLSYTVKVKNKYIIIYNIIIYQI